MADYRTLFDDVWLRAWDLGGKDWTLEIRKVEAGVLENHRQQKKERKPVVHFKGARKPLALNRTNAKTIAALYGKDTVHWIGKRVTLYPTTTNFGPEEGIDCIRIRPKEPTGKAQTLAPVAPPPAEESTPDSAARCATGTCGTCAMCLETAEAERRAQESS